MRCLLILLLLSGLFAAENVAITNFKTSILAGSKNGAAYLDIHNRHTQTVTLYKIDVDPKVFDRVELHDHVERTKDDGTKYMEMLDVPAMEITPGHTLVLQPGGKHLMLMEIKPNYCQFKKLTFKFYFRDKLGKKFVIESKVTTKKGTRCQGSQSD